MSVALADETPGQAAVLAGFDGYGLAAFTAAIARHECFQAVARAPLPDCAWHAHVIGTKTDAVRDHFRRRSAIIVTPRK